MSEPKIAMIDVHKAFGPKRVLNGVTLSIGAGESVVIIGGSGTGKSVTIKSIIGLLRPDSGSITIDGRETIGIGPGEREAILGTFGMLFQGAALFDSLPVWENVAFALRRRRRLGRRQAREIVAHKLRQVGISPDSMDAMPAELSGGQQKRVGLARAIATDPEVMVFDEPTTGLDPIMGDVINDLIVSCVHDLGATAVTITHDMRSARKIGHRIAMIYKGRIQWVGPADDIDRCGDPYVEQFINGRKTGPIELDVRSA